MSYSLSNDFVWKEVGDQVVILHLNSGNYNSLNDTASLIWKGLMDGLNPEMITKKLCEVFTIDEVAAKKDTEDMIQQFLAKKAIINK